jgi:AraC-like DNA-binding protein
MIFGLVLLMLVGLSTWLGTYIPESLYLNGITQIMNGCIATVCLSGAWLMIRHADGMKIRKIWAVVLFVYAFFSTTLLMRVTSIVDQPRTGFMSLQGWQMLVGNFLLWLLLLYPTEALRPGWLNLSRAILHGLPAVIAFVVDEVTSIDLRIILALYPVLLIILLAQHIRHYRVWCEENYSTLDHIDAQWIVRYIIMCLFDGVLFFTLCFVGSISVAFTQQWLLLLIIGYSTEQILFRQDPQFLELEVEEEEPKTTVMESNVEYRQILEEWMEKEKPYLNPAFRLNDLRKVLPLNRTYLSQLINSEYGCSFYQFVTNYRIRDAKRLLKEQPDMKMQDIAEHCGFSSPTVFARIFARETGKNPSEWCAKQDANETI